MFQLLKSLSWAAITGFVLLLAQVSLSSAAEPDRLSVAYCLDCVPFQHQDDKGEPAGLIIDYWRLWTEKTGVSVDFVAAPWGETLKMVSGGAADAHAGLFYTEERDKFLDYGSALRKTDTHVFFHQSIPTTTEFRQLAAYRVGVLHGDTVESYLKERVPGGHIVGYPDYQTIVEALKTGELKVFAADTPTGLFHLKKAGLLAEFSFVGDGPLYRSDWFTAAREGDTTTIALINRGMALITEDEKREIGRRWIGDFAGAAKDDSLIVAINRGYPPFTFMNTQGRPAGLFVDIWRAWSVKTGRKVRFRASSWAETIEGLKAGEVDLHSGLSFSDERARWIGFSEQIYETSSRIYHRSGDEAPADIGSFGDSVLGVWAGTYQEAQVRKLYPDTRVRSFTATKDMVDALILWKIDAFLQESQVMDTVLRDMGLQGKIVARPEHLFVSTIHAGMLKDRKSLLAAVDQGLEQLTSSELAEIEARWIVNPKSRFHGRSMSDSDIGLTHDEREWLNAHPVIRLGSDRAWPPYEYLDPEGVHRGLSAEFISRIEEILNIKFQPPLSLPWTETLGRAQKGDLDILTAVAPTPERQKFFKFTKPYITWHNVIAIRPDTPGIAGFEDLKGRRVGVVDGYAIHETLLRESPEIDVVPFKDIPEGLTALSDGGIDAFIDSPGTISHFTEQLKLENIALVAETPYKMEIALAVRKEWPELASILNKALVKIPNEERIRLLEAAGLQSQVSLIKAAEKPSELLSREDTLILAAVIAVVVVVLIVLGQLIRTQKKPFFHSLRGKSIVFIGGVFVLTGGATLWVLGFVGDRITEQLGSYVAERQVLWHKEKVIGAVTRELALAEKMSQSEILIRWAEDEENPSIAAAARDELQRYHDSFKAKSYFVGLAKSRHFFYADEKVGKVTLKVVDTLTRDDSDDVWFFTTSEDEAPYNLNVDHNVQLGVTNLWINYAMRRGGKTHGVVGTGIHLTEFIRDFVSKDSEGITTMMIDGNGSVRAHVDPSKIDRNVLDEDTDESTGIWKLLSSEEDRKTLRRHLGKLGKDAREAETMFLTVEGKRNLVAVAYLEPLDWYTLALIEPGGVVGLQETGTLAVVLGLALLITVVVFIIGQNMLIVAPLNQLSQGAQRLSGGDYGVRLPITQRDEIGDLTHTFNTMASTISEYMHTLEAKVEARTNELSTKEAHLRHAMDNMPGGMLMVDQDLNSVVFNNQYKELLAFSDDTMIEGQSIVRQFEFQAERGDYGTGTADEMMARITKQIESGETARYERRIGDRDLEIDLAPTPDGGFVAVAGDITERKQAEEELRKARDAAEEATKAKATFLATMSHEIRTPMGGVIGMVDLLQQTKMTDDQRQMINTVGDSAHSLLTIINDILDFSKIEAGKLDLEEIPISVRDVVEGAGEALAVNARNKDIGLSVYVDPDIPDALVGDQVRLRQILFNFGTNAIKFTEKGKVFIRADMMPSEDKGKATVRLQVIDVGIGIPEEAQAKLFQAFSQVDASTTRKFGGTGLGLTICQRLTEIMNGEIGVESVLGEGSTFSATVTLPIAKEHTFKSDGHDLSGLIVLAAIGDDDMRELLPRYLKHWDATVTAIGEIDDVKSLALKAAKAGEPFNVIYLNSAWPLTERISLIESLAAEKALSSARYVLAFQGRVRAERKEIDNTIYVDSDPLRRGALIKSIAVAAGRASPEVEYDENAITLDTGKAPTVAEAEAMGQLILLAEDNVTNQDVIRRQLTMLGYALEIANDGKEALELLKSKSFAILLTDCHMPNMDGFELTETIRTSEKGGDRRFPIIAVTASVMKEETDRCIASGMDDYLAKPLEMKKLKETLHKWMPASDGVVAEVVDEPAAKETTDKPEAEASGDAGNGAIDPTALKSVFGDDEATFKEILNDFVEPATSNVEDIETSFAERSADGVAKAAHKLKSSARSVGANELADLCQTLEEAGKADDWDEIDKAAPHLPSAMEKVVEYINNL